MHLARVGPSSEIFEFIKHSTALFQVGPRVVLLDNELVVVGGLVDGEPSRECEAYNTSKKRWQAIPKISTGCLT